MRLDEGEGNFLREAKWLENNCSDEGGREGGSRMLEGGRSSSQPVQGGDDDNLGGQRLGCGVEKNTEGRGEGGKKWGVDGGVNELVEERQEEGRSEERSSHLAVERAEGTACRGEKHCCLIQRIQRGEKVSSRRNS